VAEADFIKVSKGKAQERHFFLFNDLLLYAKRLKRKDNYVLKDRVSLEYLVCAIYPSDSE
jgi:hypothetical protein